MASKTVTKKGAGVVNFYERLPKEFQQKTVQYKNYDEYRISIPNRILVVGSSGSGKTNVVLNLVLGMACWSRIYLFVKDQLEPLYARLIALLREVEEKTGQEILMVSSDLNDLPDVKVDYDPSQNNLVIIDDMIGEKTRELEMAIPLWLYGRKKNITPIFITQSYYSTPKKIRQNSNIVIFKLLGTNDLKLVMTDFSLDKRKEDLMEMYRGCEPSNVCNFFMIDNTPGQEEQYKYRHNFDPI